jgi:KipI family sensor histidine kinase inhibitor
LSVLVERFGERAIVLATGERSSLEVQRRIWGVARAAQTWDAVVDVVCGDGNLTVFVRDPDAVDVERVVSRLQDAWGLQDGLVVEASRLIEIPVRYDGLDLGDVAAHAGLSVGEVVALHTAGEYVALFVGFLPGFAYLGGLDARLAVPRRAVPRAGVAAGSVAIGGELTAVYPLASPGGWNVIGRTDAVMFDARRSPAAAIAPGDRVRFVEAR